MIKPDAQLCDLFNAFAKKAVMDFPHIKGKLLVIDRMEGGLYGDLPDSEARTAIIGKEAYRADPPPGHHRAHAAMHLIEETATLARVILVEQFSRTRRAMMPFDRTYEEEAHGIMLHELGHLVVPGAYTGTKTFFKERGADLFALMSQMQCDQNANPDLSVAIFARTLHMCLFSRESHYTAPAVKILRDMDFKEDILALSPTETANAAFRAADFGSMGHRDIGPYFWHIRHVEGGLGKKLEAVADLLLHAQSPSMKDVAIACANLLNPVLAHNYSVTDTQIDRAELQSISFASPFWDNVRDKIADLRRVQGRSPAMAATRDDLLESCRNEIAGLYTLGHFDREKNSGESLFIDPRVYAQEDARAERRLAIILYAAMRHMQHNGGAFLMQEHLLTQGAFEGRNRRAVRALDGALAHLLLAQESGVVEFLSHKETARYARRLAASHMQEAAPIPSTAAMVKIRT